MLMRKSAKLKILNSAFCLCLVVAFFITGCNKSGQGQNSPEIQKQSAEENIDLQKVPDELEDIEESIEEIISELGGPAKSKKEDEKEGGEKSGQSKKETESKKETDQQEETESEKNQSDSDDIEKGKSEESSEQKEEDKKKQDEKSKSDENKNQEVQDKGGAEKKEDEKAGQKDPWQKISSTIDKLHYDWSSYTPKAVKSGANSSLIDSFGKALNNLTTSAKEKNTQNTLLSANHLYGYLPDFYMLYKEQNSPEIKRVRYFIRNSALSAVTGDWEKCDLNVKSLKSSWSLYKNTINNEVQEPASKLDFSIYELEKVVNERNVQLIDIKSRVALSNVDALEEAVKNQPKGSTNQTGGGGESSGEGKSGGKSGGGEG
ncbi:MAG TPA: hypothetical protein GXX20_01910 [Clostridiaceae bacterium]|nr:hypothetical protein [Clostridiaceae bacterium]